MIKIDFEYDTPYGKFGDALWFSDSTTLPTESELELLKQSRLNAWIELITKPSATTEPLVEQQPEVASNN